MMIIKNRKAVSPVIATVILVAVAITISVAVAYWMGGISSQYTKFEKVEVTNAVVTAGTGSNGTQWTIVLSLKNTGTAQATLTNVFVNDRELTYSATPSPDPDAGNGAWYASVTSIPSGSSQQVTLVIENGDSGQPFSSLSSGTTINMKFHSAGGMDYLKLIELV